MCANVCDDVSQHGWCVIYARPPILMYLKERIYGIDCAASGTNTFCVDERVSIELYPSDRMAEASNSVMRYVDNKKPLKKKARTNQRVEKSGSK